MAAELWCYWRDGLGPKPNTFGPFGSREAAEAALEVSMQFGTAWGSVFDAADPANRHLL